MLKTMQERNLLLLLLLQANKLHFLNTQSFSDCLQCRASNYWKQSRNNTLFLGQIWSKSYALFRKEKVQKPSCPVGHLDVKCVYLNKGRYSLMWPYGDLPLDRVWFLSFVLNRVHNLRARGVLLGILGGGVPPGSPNPDPISDQKM